MTMTVKQAADSITASGLMMTRDLDEICDMVRRMADGMAEPEAGWFMADVLDEVNGREMALKFEERFLEPYRDCTLTVVDCHI